MPENHKQHIRFQGFSENLSYKYPGSGPRPAPPKQQDREIHGRRLLRQLQTVQEELSLSAQVELPEGIIRDDAIYVDFISEWGHPLKLESLEQDRIKPEYLILNIREEHRESNGAIEARYFVTVMMTQGGISKFINKVEQYLNENIFNKGNDTGNPKNHSLLNNIQRIRSATLQSFWTDAPEVPFPDETENIWWEVWFRRTEEDEGKIEEVLQNLRGHGVEIGLAEIIFAEHRVRLVRGTAIQLSQSLLLLDNLAELRKPQEIADFITHRDASYEDREDWLEELIGRVEPRFDENGVLICLLDSGVNNQHPLISPFLPEHNLYSFKPDDWGTYDSWLNGGHGTGVAGLALYGDLVDAIANPHQIQITHGLESFKILQENDPNSPEFYGPITEYACTVPFIEKPNNLRVFCMTITAKELAFRGRPSAWSAAVDKVAFGSTHNPKAPQLFIVSGGNVIVDDHDEHPSKNYLESIHDPAQSYNALTIGAYTRKDRIDQKIWPGWAPLAQNGAMSPSNSTSTVWEHQWPIKPDIVMEGGNSSTNGMFTGDIDSLKVLTTDKGYPGELFLPFGDTSGAAALASKMAAELRTAYPEYWPETIRALMVHSAEWTDAMLEGREFSSLNETERRNLLRSVGYGVPIKEKALFSANNSLTLIAERHIQPYKLNGSQFKYNEYHLFNLPWPTDILGDALYDKDVTLKVTLSYFIEPNPGSKNRRYANNFHYHSHALTFSVIKPGESIEGFKRRISASSELADEDRDGSDEPWLIKRVRSRGSILKDFVTMSGADMARRNMIAVYPKSGWYKTRKKLGKGDSTIRYSLVITVETPETDIDLHTPVFNQIENQIII